MFKNLLSWMGLAKPETVERFSPYSQQSINRIYNQLFCDEPDLFRPLPQMPPTSWQSILFSEPADRKTVRKIAEDETNEGRVRVLAYNWLRANGHEIPKQILLGVIVEVPLEGGLDVLAAYSDRGVRYINQTGSLAVIEGEVPAIKPFVESLFAVSREVISQIGPWEEARKPPPPPGSIRFTFLVSDGLYFGQGPMKLMEKDPMGGPVVATATQLLQFVVRTTTKAD